MGIASDSNLTSIPRSRVRIPLEAPTVCPWERHFTLFFLVLSETDVKLGGPPGVKHQKMCTDLPFMRDKLRYIYMLNLI